MGFMIKTGFKVLNMLTFEKIRELERAETKNKSLQKLPENFVSELSEYLQRKKNISKDPSELENIQNTIKRFFELREHKILDMLIYQLRTGMNVENLSPEEEILFNKLFIELKKHRKNFFNTLKRKQDNTVFRVKENIPEFIGPDMKKYKLIENEIVTLPKPLNELLLKNGLIKALKQECD